MNLSAEQKQTHRQREQACGCMEERGVGRKVLEIWN